jgi:hypothetical protein
LFFNLNQLFIQHYPDDKVVSFQLEIGKKGFRDTEDNVKKTAERLAQTFSAVAGIDKVKAEIVEARASLPATPTREMIDSAVGTILEIYQKYACEAMIQVGNYIIETFFSGDFEHARNPRNIAGDESIRQLHKKLGEQVGVRPSKTWVYDAIKVAVDAHFFDFQTYGNLTISHRVKIAYVKDDQLKQSLIEQCDSNQWTVRQLDEKIKESKAKKKTETLELLAMVTNPKLIFKGHSGKEIKERIAKLPPADRRVIKEKVKNQAEKLDKKIQELESLKDHYRELAEDIENI